MVDKETLYYNIDKYLAGESNEIEKRNIDTWYNSFEKFPGFTPSEKREVIKSGKRIFLKIVDTYDQQALNWSKSDLN